MLAFLLSHLLYHASIKDGFLKKRKKMKDGFLEKVKNSNQDNGKKIKESLDLENPLWMSSDPSAIVFLLL